MKAKKLVALVLALCMAGSMAACGGNNNSSTSSGSSAAGGDSSVTEESSAAETDDTAEGDGELYRVRLSLPTMMTIPAESEVQKVEDAINAHIHDDLGIADLEMDLELLNLTDYETNMTMALASGEKYDIILSTKLNTYVTNGYMADLTPYVDNELAGALEVLPENWIRSGTIGDKIYAVPCYKGQVLSWKYIYDEATYGDATDWSKVNSLETLAAVLPDLKAAAPNERPMVYNNQLVNLTMFEDHTSPVGIYTATVGDSTELVNYFATDSFKKGVEMAYEWSQAGYSDPEGSTNTLTHDAIVMSGQEGESYVWNEGKTSIEYPEGLDINTVPYTALYTCGAFGNQFILYPMDANTSEADKGFMEELIEGSWYPPLFGFIPDSTNVSTQVAAVSNVYDQYFKVLTYGDVNPDEYLPQFLTELEAAGINDIIAEYQTQADAWLETIQ